MEYANGVAADAYWHTERRAPTALQIRAGVDGRARRKGHCLSTSRRWAVAGGDHTASHVIVIDLVNEDLLEVCSACISEKQLG
jgi:hypothetical protein